MVERRGDEKRGRMDRQMRQERAMSVEKEREDARETCWERKVTRMNRGEREGDMN